MVIINESAADQVFIIFYVLVEFPKLLDLECDESDGKAGQQQARIKPACYQIPVMGVGDDQRNERVGCDVRYSKA